MCYTSSMSDIALKKVTVNLPMTLLLRMQEMTGLGITATLIKGLRELEKREKRSALKQLRGKLNINLDLERTRQ